MHVDVAVRAELGAFPATDAPILDDDFEVFLAPNGADRALRHAKWIARRSASRRDQKMIVAQAIAQQTGDAVVRLRASLHTGIAARAVIQIDEQEILRLK